MGLYSLNRERIGFRSRFLGLVIYLPTRLRQASLEVWIGRLHFFHVWRSPC